MAKISSKLSTACLTYDFLAHRVGEQGCTFSPTVFTGTRKNENFAEQQLFAIDVDDKVTFSEVKERADRYRLPVLFAYRSFSWSEEHEKFRVVFAVDRVITDSFTAQVIQKMLMSIFPESDAHCSDLARMYYGSNKGLLYFSEIGTEISLNELVIAVNSYMYDKYDESHYAAKIKEVYDSLGVETKRKVPVVSCNDGNIVVQKAADKKSCSDKNKIRRKDIDFDKLKEHCQLYRDFAEGNEWYYYPELFHIAANMVNMKHGKEQFLNILNSPENSQYESYRNRDWKPILNTIIDMGYKPISCNKCPHVAECAHYKNMILTVSPGYCGILPVEVKEYCTISEAEESLRQSISRAVYSDDDGIHIIKAATGLGKTHAYLNLIKDSDERFLVVVPTHKLIREILVKAESMGIEFCTMPELTGLSAEITDMMHHIYDIGAGAVGINQLRKVFADMEENNPDYPVLKEYLTQYDSVKYCDGNILITHERFLNLTPESLILRGRRVIIDEDIIRSAFAVETVSIDDVEKALNSGYFDFDAKERFQEILKGETYQRYENKVLCEVDTLTPEILDDINSNVIDLLCTKALIKNEDSILYMKIKPFPCNKAVIMSATANADIYRWLMYKPVMEYRCKDAKYMGTVNLYTDSTYSRDALINGDDHEILMEKIKAVTGDNDIITFKAIEDKFGTEYHLGGIEGLNCLEGRDISVVGLPNVDEKVYKLYGMMTGVNPEEHHMSYMKTKYNGYEFWMNTFKDYHLRTIQMWMIESLLEQAVGRARLLRYDCTVNVFARFPVEQANFI
ncbi:MAG: DEAD/DEAH box helicase family protein [Oscillospiraceae bacterium]|nr:DEAD/DEAH box helicase family protein [Oscillospiraceae bacterium]